MRSIVPCGLCGNATSDVSGVCGACKDRNLYRDGGEVVGPIRLDVDRYEFESGLGPGSIEAVYDRVDGTLQHVLVRLEADGVWKLDPKTFATFKATFSKIHQTR